MTRTRATAVRTSTAMIAAHGVMLGADLGVPTEPLGLIVMAYEGGGGRRSSRNLTLAAALQEHGFATLLLDLLTAQESALDAAGQLLADVELVAPRLVAALDWLRERPETRGLHVGVMAAGVGAAAALAAAATRPDVVGAVVSWAGRPQLAERWLSHVVAPTLLLVGAYDSPNVAMNRYVLARLQEAELVIIERAGHTFHEPGALEEVAQLAMRWFERHLGATPLLEMDAPAEEVC